MEENLLRERIKQIVHHVLKDNKNNMVINDEDIINVPFTIDGANFNKAAVLDSVEIVSIIVEIENEFQIQISDENMINFKTINDLTKIVVDTLNNHNNIEATNDEENNE